MTFIAKHYLKFNREQWRKLAQTTPFPLNAKDVERLRGLGDPIDITEADLIYRTLSGLLQVYVSGTSDIHANTKNFLHYQSKRTPFVIGIAGSVAVGKSSTARLIQELLRRWPQTPRVEIITTDGFLLPNKQLVARGIMDRKGFPESYDRKRLLDFLEQIKSGVTEVEVPVYDHLIYDIVPGKSQLVSSPDILIVEGLNVLQPPRLFPDNTEATVVSDFFDFSIYVDAQAQDIEKWYLERFMKLRSTAFASPKSYFHRYTQISLEEAQEVAQAIWHKINLPNLEKNILPTRPRATLILTKDAKHQVESVNLRRL